MKYLILLAIVVQALAVPQGKPENGGPGNGNPPSRPFPPPSGVDHPLGHPNVTGHPPHDESYGTRQPPTGSHPPRHHMVTIDIARSAQPPKSGIRPLPMEPKPIGGNPPVTGRPPVSGEPPNKPGQPPARPKRHLKGAEGRPTGAPHVGNHTHDSTGIHPTRPTHASLGTAGDHRGEKGHGSGPWQKQRP